MKLRDLPTEMEKRGEEGTEHLHWHPSFSSPDFWVGLVWGLFTKEKLTTSEAIDLILELESAGAGDTPYFKDLKQRAYEKYKADE